MYAEYSKTDLLENEKISLFFIFARRRDTVYTYASIVTAVERSMQWRG